MKIKAFTLIQVTIALILVSIVLLLTIMVYSIILGYFTSFQNEYLEQADLINDCSILKQDFAGCNHFWVDKDKIFIKTNYDIIQYSVNTDIVVRKKNQILDTLSSVIDNLEMTNNGKNKTKSITFELVLNEKSIPFVYSSKVSNANLVNSTKNAN